MSSRSIGRALAVAAHGLSGDVRERVLARIAGPTGAMARAAGEATRRDRAAWAAHARLPVTPGLRGIHPSWLEDALGELPVEARRAIAGERVDRAGVWLARWACAGFAELSDDDPVTAPDEPAAWLADIGADQLAVAARAAGDALFAATSKRYPEIGEAARRIAMPPRAGNLGPARAAIGRCRALLAGQPLDAMALVLIGARCVAPHLDAFQRRALALRLPRALGLQVESELAAHAATPLDQVPAWIALAP